MWADACGSPKSKSDSVEDEDDMPDDKDPLRSGVDDGDEDGDCSS